MGVADDQSKGTRRTVKHVLVENIRK